MRTKHNGERNEIFIPFHMISTDSFGCVRRKMADPNTLERFVSTTS
jgi:hypothetical protein